MLPTVPPAAPRVYLDTGVLAIIADEKVPTNEVAALHAALQEVGAAVVIGVGHLVDIHRGMDAPTRARVALAINALPCKALAVVNPLHAESVRAPRPLQELSLAAFEDITALEYFSDPNAGMGLVGDSVTWIADAERASRANNSGALAGPEQWATSQRMLEVLITARSVEDVARAMLDPIFDPIEYQRQLGVIRALWPILQMAGSALRQPAATLGLSPAEFVGQLAADPAAHAVPDSWIGYEGGYRAWNRAARLCAPGSALVAAVARRNEATKTRKPGYGDVADRLHVCMVPYVDLATVDGNNLAAIEPELPSVRTIRRARALRNPGKSLADLTVAIGALCPPTVVSASG